MSGGLIMLTVRSIAENIAESTAFTYLGKTNGQNSEVHVRMGSDNRPKYIYYYPNVTTLRSGLCYRNSVCRLSSVVRNVGAPYSGG